MKKALIFIAWLKDLFEEGSFDLQLTLKTRIILETQAGLGRRCWSESALSSVLFERSLVWKICSSFVSREVSFMWRSS